MYMYENIHVHSVYSVFLSVLNIDTAASNLIQLRFKIKLILRGREAMKRSHIILIKITCSVLFFIKVISLQS